MEIFSLKYFHKNTHKFTKLTPNSSKLKHLNFTWLKYCFCIWATCASGTKLDTLATGVIPADELLITTALNGVAGLCCTFPTVLCITVVGLFTGLFTLVSREVVGVVGVLGFCKFRILMGVCFGLFCPMFEVLFTIWIVWDAPGPGCCEIDSCCWLVAPLDWLNFWETEAIVASMLSDNEFDVALDCLGCCLSPHAWLWTIRV